MLRDGNGRVPTRLLTHGHLSSPFPGGHPHLLTNAAAALFKDTTFMGHTGFLLRNQSRDQGSVGALSVE